jgi:protein-disulfide isomerase
MKNKNIIIVSLISLILIFIVGSYFYKDSQSNKSLSLSKENSLLLERPHSYTIGKKDAKIQLVEFFDPACRTCALYHSYTKEILNKYNGEVKLVLRYAPFHKNSNYAVMMLEGAKAQGKFLETLDIMFATQKYWVKHHVVQPSIIWEILSKTKLDMKELDTYMNSPKTNLIIKQDLEDAKKLNITKTPGYLVNGKPLQEFGLENLIKLIEEERLN